MKTKISTIYLLLALTVITFTGCSKEGPVGPAGIDGQNAAVYYSEWFSPSAWSGTTGDWYFSASAPDLTQNVVESGVVLAYVWITGDMYSSTTVRPLPAYAVGANWSFLIHQYGFIEFTSDESLKPLTTHKFRFIAIPGTSTAYKSASTKYKTKSQMINMPYSEACQLFNIKDSLQIPK
ncbi:MAG: hypothetical protein WCJ61_06715 [Paludibacter sp.]